MSIFSVTMIAASAFTGALEGIPAPAARAPRPFVVIASEYAFRSPDTLTSGVVTVRLVNRGKRGHQLSFARLDDSTSQIRVMRSLVSNKERTTGVHWTGGVESALPGDSSEATLALLPGRYIIVCAYEGDSGHAHMSMGMLRALTVKAGGPTSGIVLAATPTSIRLFDYRIEVDGKLHSGRQLVRIENVGAHRHHLYIVRIVGTATMADLDKWDGRSQPAPLEEIGGGLAVLDPGEAGTIAVALKRGRYALGCLLSDGPAGKPHYLLGMEKEITVQ